MFKGYEKVVTLALVICLAIIVGRIGYILGSNYGSSVKADLAQAQATLEAIQEDREKLVRLYRGTSDTASKLVEANQQIAELKRGIEDNPSSKAWAEQEIPDDVVQEFKYRFGY